MKKYVIMLFDLWLCVLYGPAPFEDNLLRSLRFSPALHAALGENNKKGEEK
jgi:hypothetical protein